MDWARIYLIALAVTLVTELPVVWAFYRGRVKPAWHLPLTFLMVNLLTHGGLWTLWPYLGWTYEVRLVVGELAVWIIEAAAYVALLRGGGGRAMLASLLANAVSVAAGYVTGVV